MELYDPHAKCPKCGQNNFCLHYNGKMLSQPKFRDTLEVACANCGYFFGDRLPLDRADEACDEG